MSIVKSFAVGCGDMFYIKHNSDNFSIIDCSLSDDNKESIVGELKTERRSRTLRGSPASFPRTRTTTISAAWNICTGR